MMIKKIAIILCWLFLLSNTQAITLNTLIDSAKSIWTKEVYVPNFSLTDIDGKVHTHKSTKGKYLIVNFWATWCPPCLQEIPAFVDFYAKHKDKVLILGLNHENADKNTIIKFKDRFSVNYPIILFTGKNTNQFDKFGKILGLPTTYIYATDGRLLNHHLGELKIEDLQKIITPKS